MQQAVIHQRMFWIFIGLICLGQLQRFALPSGGAIYGHELYMVLWLLASGAQLLRQGRLNTVFAEQKKQLLSQVQRHPIWTSGIALSATTTIAQLTLNLDYTGLLYVLRLLLYIAFGYGVWLCIQKNALSRELVRAQVVAAGAIILFLGFLQYAYIPDTRFLAIFGWDDHYGRLMSTLFDPGFTAIIIWITLLYGQSLSLKQNYEWLRKGLWLMGLLGIALTFSRATYLTAAVVSGASALRARASKSSIVVVVCCALCVVILIPKPWGEGVDLFRTASITARLTAVQLQLENLKLKTLVVGNGLFSYQNSLWYLSEQQGLAAPTQQFDPNDSLQTAAISHSRMPDNLFLTILLSFGIGGLIFWIALILKFTLYYYQRDAYLGLALFSVLLHSQFHNTLLHPFVLIFIILGVATAQKSPTA